MIETPRLVLRQWRDKDIEPYCQLCADPEVMRYFPSVLTDQESADQIARFRELINQNGWGFWALELKQNHELIGMVGLHYQDSNSGLPNAPLLEIGWRLSAKYWGNGYAPEAARAALNYGFEHVVDGLGLAEIHAFTAGVNLPSQRVMEKIGMSNTGNDFLHPKLERDHWLAPHVLYSILK
ncbi:GCN5 family acetyltransferase [Photobacterium jeanii]|uniref:GCN5 family acetyltransferase n=1 Tax=Photobacterium jeanii TaxID=858640 RepID=A0A178K3E6_9GAMM|nr:GNAT family N-acetyltransferase [Photobacterium jeanii]OAN11626.1 GCN5 family acetyltransferase [Photobacterium jeanii]PST91147.1 N-acetyltransferase [Photobacterium jeanii]